MGSIPIPGTKRINHLPRRRLVNAVVAGVTIVAHFHSVMHLVAWRLLVVSIDAA